MSFPLLEEARLFLEKFERIEQVENNEPMVAVPKARELFRFQQSPWSYTLLLGHHYLRETVLQKLLAGAREVKTTLGRHYRVVVLDTYRPPPVQRMNFTLVSAWHRRAIPELTTERDSRAYTNMFTAIPEFGGHPCGAAIDLTLMDLRTGQVLEFGMHQVKTIFHVSRELGPVEMKPELKETYETLCDIMKAQGFYMTPCEWWHFGFGDIEWAVLTGQSRTLYTAVPWRPQLAFGQTE